MNFSVELTLNENHFIITPVIFFITMNTVSIVNLRQKTVEPHYTNIPRLKNGAHMSFTF